MSEVQSQSVLILGLGVSGAAAAELALADGAAVTVLDVASNPRLEERAALLRSRGADVRLEWNLPHWAARVELAVISPGIPPESVLGRLAAALPCPVLSELEYGFRHTACPVLAITGTNGKTTTTELLTACLNHAGKRALAAGNIGTPLCEAARKSAALDFLVVEVSSFQLEQCAGFAPLAATILNITPDHLDRYAGMSGYAQAKTRLFAHMSRAGQIVLRADLPAWPEVAAALPRDGSAPVTFTADGSETATYFLRADGFLCRRDGATVQPLLHQDRLRLIGRHNVENVLAATALAAGAGVPFAAIADALTAFAPSPHRIELVAVHRGVKFVNDSKGTNPDAVCQAIRAVAPPPPGKILLIAGGLDKGLEFSLVKPLLAKHVKQVFLIGKCRKELANQWKDTVYCQEFSSLEAAFDGASELAGSGDVVLLSPGCASMDMFENYAARGRSFCELVKRRTGE